MIKSYFFGLVFLGISFSAVSQNSIAQDSIATKGFEKMVEYNQSKLHDFLLNPLDHIAFKETKGTSNSGGWSSKLPLYRPEKKGFYYRYMLFRTPLEYSGSIRFSFFNLIVYKYGDTPGNFYDKDEELIGIRCRLRDPDLGKMNLVGLATIQIDTLLGPDYIVKDNVRIYTHKDRVLALCIKRSQVSWFQYYRLATTLNKEDIPELLLYFIEPGD